MTSSSEVEERPRDALCPSVVILNKIITRAESLITVSYRLQIYLCVMLFLVFWGFLSYTSSFFPAINKRGRLPVTSVINSSLSVAAKCIALAAGMVHNTVKPDIGSESDFCVPHLHSTLPLGRGVSVGIFPCRLVQKNQNCVATPWSKNLKIRLFVLTESTNVTDGHTGKQTPHDG